MDWQNWRDKYPKASQQLNDEKKRKRQEKAEKKKKKMKRQKKDPNAPKRAMSAFMFRLAAGPGPPVAEETVDRVINGSWGIALILLHDCDLRVQIAPGASSQADNAEKQQDNPARAPICEPPHDPGREVDVDTDHGCPERRG